MTLRDQIQQVIETEPVAVFMKGTPERPACGNSLRALQALWNAGAPITPWRTIRAKAIAVRWPSNESAATFAAEARKLATIGRLRPTRSETRPLR